MKFIFEARKKVGVIVILVSICCLFFTPPFNSQSASSSAKIKVANRGYDLVTYHQFNDPRKGSKDFNIVYKDLEYRFISKNNLNAFQKNPGKYMPEYDGWCAYGMAKGGKHYRVNPKAYEIIEGKLYLFYHFSIFNYLKKWQSNNPQELLRNADDNWLHQMVQ